jgi:hypothetical protein
MKWDGKIWVGVYKSFEEAPSDTGYFDKKKWLRQEEEVCKVKVKAS